MSNQAKINKPEIWLIWSRKGPALSLCAVDMEKSIAEVHLAMTRRLPGIEEAWIEKREANHLYGHVDLMVGEEWLRTRRQMSQVGRWRKGDFEA